MNLWKSAALAIAVMASGATQGATVAIGNGIEWSWTSGDVGESSGTITLHANVANSELGDVRLHSFSLKGEGFGVDTADAGSAWKYMDEELTANGCTGGEHEFNMCFDSTNLAN